MKNKRILIAADLHSGHLIGLTPPKYQSTGKQHREKYETIQRQCWKFFTDTIASLGKIDILVLNGDLIDGTGKKSGGTELLSTDRLIQCEMAAACINYIKADKTIMTVGTSYHVGDKEDWEQIIADKIKADKIGSHEWLDVNGCIIDIKHHIGNSSMPGGGYAAVAQDQIHNLLWAAHDEQPKADIIIRSHVHKYRQISDGHFMACTTPALQAMGSKFGSRRCSGRVDFGLLVIDIDSTGGFKWQPHLAKIVGQQARAMQL